MGMCKKNDLKLSQETEIYAKSVFTKMHECRGSDYANGRDVRNYFEKALVNQANRLAGSEQFSDEDLTTLIVDDLKLI